MMQPCVRACPVEVDDSTFADLIDQKGAKLSSPTTVMGPPRPIGEPEGEPGCGDAPLKLSPGCSAMKPNSSPLLNIDGKPGSVFSQSFFARCVRKAGMCMMILSAVGLNFTVLLALSQSWQPAADTNSQTNNVKVFRRPVKFPVESSTVQMPMRVSSKLTPMIQATNPEPAKASKGEAKAEAKLTSKKNTKTDPATKENAPAQKAIPQPPPQVAFVKQESKVDKKAMPEVAAAPPPDSPSAGLGLGDAPISSRSLLKSQPSSEESHAERHGEFLIKMMAPDDEVQDDDTDADEEKKPAVDKAVEKEATQSEQKKLEDMLHEAEQEHLNDIHKASLLKPELTPEPTAHPLGTHSRLQTPEDDNEGGVVARWGSMFKKKFGSSQNPGTTAPSNVQAASSAAPAIPLWEAARLKLPSPAKIFR